MTPRRFQQLSIRNKLLVLVLLPLVVVLPLLSLILLTWAGTAFDRLLITKVRSDLAVAQGYFDRVIGDLGASAGSVADSHELHLALARNDPVELADMLRRLKLRYGFDFINLRAPDGALRLTPFGTPAQVVEAAAADAAAPRGLGADGQAGVALELLAPQALGLVAPDLLSRVAVPLVATRNAAPTARREEERAMVGIAAAPVRAADGAMLGYVQAGVLLNRNLAFIDHINEIVYPKGSLPFGSQGTATLFLEDVRITTNVHLFGGDPQADRAIGTRVSQTVRQAVLGRGNTWLDRAFVVDEWYVSAYRPLEDSARQRIGMLYVGYLERPFTWLKYGMLAAIGVVFFAVMVAAALVSLRWARAVFRPLEQMAQTMRRVESGALDARVGAVQSGDEIGQLAGHLDRLLEAVARQTTALRCLNAELDAKVKERTQALEDTQAQLLRAERLAAMGQLTASIAHEVNNPIAVIQGNLDVVRELLGPDAQRVRGELRLVDEQIERMRLIVTQMLQFARPGEFSGDEEAVDPARALDDSLLLVEHLRATQRAQVKRHYTATRRAVANRHQLQQVLVNLLMNALYSMPDGGRLEVSTRDEGDDGVAIDVADTGAGLGAELLAELFKPFVTRRKDGTGLGLWISRSIAERYGGTIAGSNRTDGPQGALFTVRLKSEAPS